MMKIKIIICYSRIQTTSINCFGGAPFRLSSFAIISLSVYNLMCAHSILCPVFSIYCTHLIEFYIFKMNLVCILRNYL